MLRTDPRRCCRVDVAVALCGNPREDDMIRTTILASLAALSLAACSPPAPETATTTADGTAAAEALQKQGADVVAAFGNAAGGASNPHMKAFTTNFTKIADEIALVKDEASANALGEKLKPYIAEMEKAAKAIEAMPENEKQAAAMSSGPQLIQATTKMMGAMMTLSPELQEIVNKQLENMPEAPT
jgi:hypothetical protein